MGAVTAKTISKTNTTKISKTYDRGGKITQDRNSIWAIKQQIRSDWFVWHWKYPLFGKS